ncbi:MAG: glycoside hydrolase family 127 protein [Planctomycetes bacterium]|nr:glycoside hydrolase family 127 protein [Planctomycetota bacterium]
MATILIGLCLLIQAPTTTAPAVEGGLRAIPFTCVKFEDDFWAPRIRTTIEKTIPWCFDQCEKTGRIANWEKAAKKEGKFEGYFFNDSDVYKTIEAASYALRLDPNAKCKGRKLDEYVDELIAKIAAMQQLDGYVNSYFVLTGEPKWTDIENKHELYCAGHLIEAAVAHYQCTGKRNLLDIAIRLADHICATFGPATTQKADPCGHPEIELALIKLGKLVACLEPGRAGVPEFESALAAKLSAVQDLHTRRDFGGDPAYRYFSTAWFFVNQHGDSSRRGKLWGEYAQDHKPLIEQREIVGHAVRAMYLYSGASDVALTIGPLAFGYEPALDAIWTDLTERKMYITGGIGPSAHNEGFTTAYDLPNETAYAETCASIGLVFWAHRMNLLHADAKYYDVLERALYNNVLAAISLDGESFNYVNPPASRGRQRRQPWFACACCPPNLARLFPTVGGYMYAQNEKAIYVNMYAKSTATFPCNVANVTVKQDTRYPWDGKVDFKVSVDKPCEFDLMLRVPAWCREAKLSIGGQPVGNATIEAGYLRIAGKWKGETVLTFELPMAVERVHADPRVKADVGRVAIQVGPLVYCLEQADNPQGVRNLFCEPAAGSSEASGREGRSQPIQASRESGSGVLKSVQILKGTMSGRRAEQQQANPSHPEIAAAPFVMVPYLAWNNRDAGDMLVWIPESPAFLEPQPVAWLKPSASHCAPQDTIAALNDRVEPESSADGGVPRFTWWPKKGDEQWVQYDFDKPRKVSAVEVYWFDDSKKGGGCKAPASWRIQAKVGDAWADVRGASAAGVEADRFNRVTFEPVDASGLRLLVQLAPDSSSGILEWKVPADGK